MVVAASKDAIVMVEGGAAEAAEADVIDALMFAHRTAQPILELIERMRAAVGKPKRAFEKKTLPSDVAELIKEHRRQGHPRLLAHQGEEGPLRRLQGDQDQDGRGGPRPRSAPRSSPKIEKLVKEEFEERKYHVVREYVLSERKRIDGRDMKTIRPIVCEVGILPRVHGSALFQRGETQAAVAATLGTSSDEQKIDALIGERWKRFMLHYNFPPFSTGETKPLRGPGRREIGHGALAERALVRMMPDEEKFPYTIRVVSETLESNGSSSMAAVCGGTLSLMDAGVPLKSPVAGIAMGLISDGALTDPKTRTAILSDILGDEDHLGDMDFKVCGTKKGVTAIQMDIKIAGLSREVLTQALEQAREGRLHILDKMLATLGAAARRTSRSGRRASRRSRSSPTRSASSSARAARPSRASSTRPASPSTSRTTAR